MPGPDKPPIPPIGGGDCSLSSKLAFRTGKNVPSRAMRGSDACDRGLDGLESNPPACIGSSQRWFTIGVEDGRGGSLIDEFLVAARGPMYGGASVEVLESS